MWICVKICKLMYMQTKHLWNIKSTKLHSEEKGRSWSKWEMVKHEERITLIQELIISCYVFMNISWIDCYFFFRFTVDRIFASYNNTWVNLILKCIPGLDYHVLCGTIHYRVVKSRSGGFWRCNTRKMFSNFWTTHENDSFVLTGAVAFS